MACASKGTEWERKPEKNDVSPLYVVFQGAASMSASRQLIQRTCRVWMAIVWIAALAISAQANMALSPSAPAGGRDEAAQPGRARAKRRPPAAVRAASQNPAAAQQQQAQAEEEAVFEDVPATATLWLQEPVNPEKIEALELGDNLIVTGRIQMGDAEVFVLEWLPNQPADLPMMSIDEARAKGLLEIRELNAEEYEAFKETTPAGGGGLVVARNKAEVYVIVMGGEVLEGGHQDRMVATSAILAPKSGWVPLPVNCVEHGRGQGPTGEFKVAEAMAHPMLRAQGLCLVDQKAVWREVDRVNFTQKSQGPTKTYMMTLTQGQNRGKLLKAATSIESALAAYPKAVGFAVAWRGKVVSFERMASPALFHAQAKSMILSHLLGLASRGVEKAGTQGAGGGVAKGPAGKTGTTAAKGANAGGVKAFYQEVCSAQRQKPPLNWQGVGLVLRGGDLLGGETLSNLSPKDPSLKTLASDLGKSGAPAPGVLHQWAVRM